MDLRSIYVANGAGIFTILILYYTSVKKMLKHDLEDRIFTFMMFGVMGGCFAEDLSYTLDGKAFAGARMLNYASNTYLYTLNLLLPFSVLVYVDLGLYGNINRIREKYKPQIIVGLCMLTATFVNLFIPISYHIDENNVYARMPFSYVYYLIILYYCFSAMFLTHRYEKENGARIFFSIEMFLYPILLGAGLQFMFYGLSLAWLSSAVGLTGLYMMQQNEVAYMEEVNRRLEEYNHADHPYERALSYGMSFFDTGNVDTFMKEMDDRMYDLKVRHHKMDDLEAGRHEIDDGQAGHHEMTGNCENKMCVKRG